MSWALHHSGTCQQRVVQGLLTFNASDVVLDLHGFESQHHSGRRRTSLPRAEVAPHDEVVKGDGADQLEQLCHDLLHDALLHVVALEALPDLVEKVEDVIHARRRLVAPTAHADHAREHPATAIRGDEAGQRLGLDQCRDDHLTQLLLDLEHPRVVDVVLEAVEVMLNDANETLVRLPVQFARARLVHARGNTLLSVRLGNADEREDLLDVGEPEDAGHYHIFALELLKSQLQQRGCHELTIT